MWWSRRYLTNIRQVRDFFDLYQFPTFMHTPENDEQDRGLPDYAKVVLATLLLLALIAVSFIGYGLWTRLVSG